MNFPPNPDDKFEEVYNRYISYLDKEDKLINSRINWLFATQTALFVARVASKGTPSINIEILNISIEIIGALISFFVYISISASLIQFIKYQKGLKNYCVEVYCVAKGIPCQDNGKTPCSIKKQFPRICREKSELVTGFIASFSIPSLFIVVWSGTLFFHPLKYIISIIVPFIGLVILALFLRESFYLLTRITSITTNYKVRILAEIRKEIRKEIRTKIRSIICIIWSVVKREFEFKMYFQHWKIKCLLYFYSMD